MVSGNIRCGVGTTLGGKWEQHWMGSESIRWGVETWVRSGTMGGVWDHGWGVGPWVRSGTMGEEWDHWVGCGNIRWVWEYKLWCGDNIGWEMGL